MERERKVLTGRKKLGVALAGLAALASGCVTPNQINGIDVVDCIKGPTYGETKTDLPFGKEFQIGGSAGGGIGDYVGSLYISFEKGEGIALRNHMSYPVIYFPFSNPQLSPKEIGIDTNGVIYFRDGTVDYTIHNSLTTSGGTLDIKARCQNPLPKAS